MKTYEISEFKQGRFQDKMNRYAKKASRLGIEFGYKLTGESMKTVKVYPSQYSNESYDLTYKSFSFEVWGESPTIEGFSFLAKLEPMEDGKNLVHSHNSEYDFSGYYETELVCEHCQINRFRNFYYLIQAEDLSVKMVGGNCLANYLKMENASEIADFYSNIIIDDFSDSAEELEGFAKSGLSWIAIEKFLALARVIISKEGYAKSDCEGISTKDLTLNEWFSRKGDFEVLESDITETKSIIEFVKNELTNKSNLSNYEHTILSLLNSEYMKVNHAGYIVSIIPMYNRMTEYKIQKAEQAESVYVGTIGDKLENIQVTLTYQNEIDGFYGITYLYKFVDNSGNIFTWFSSKNQYIENGQTVTIKKTTVKDHNEYNGIKQTVITRAKLAE